MVRIELWFGIGLVIDERKWIIPMHTSQISVHSLRWSAVTKEHENAA